MTNMKIKHIVCTIDNSYVQHCVIMLTSLFYTNKNSEFHVYILSNELSLDNVNHFRKFFKWRKHKFTNINVNEELLKNAPISGHLSLATYYRILIPLIIPSEIDKILFLDSDLIVKENIDQFWKVDLSHYSHIAIENCGDNLPFIKKLEMSSDSKYFNAGILMINLKWWKEKDIYNSCMNFIQTSFDKITFHDQDVLNAVLENKWLEFPLKYNAQSYVFSTSRDALNSSDEEIKAFHNPIIIHFTGGGDSKPWFYSNKHPYKNLYEYYQSKTVFKNIEPIGKPLFKKLSLRDKFYIFRKKRFNNQKDY